FEYQKYSRDHTWKFDGGHEMQASAAPTYLGNPNLVDPEEAFVASLSSCHMLTFLAIACKKRFVLDEYSDDAVGMMEKNADGGLNGAWDYGPLGVELKRNLKNYWWRVMVHERDDVVGMDGAILTHPAVLKASGHVEGFSDPMVDCRTCNAHLRSDQVVEKSGTKKCPHCGGKDLTETRQFNLMFETHVGAAADESSIAYLRPETAQSIFVQFKNILEVSRKKLPFGIAQIGKAFRNEINPRNFTFRSREFEQMELEYFCRPEQG